MYALILAGGRGERLRPLTDTIPKPMVPVSGKPILWHQVQWLKRGGVTDVVFLAGYRWEAIEGFFGDGSTHGFSAHYSIEDTPLGRGGAIRKGMSIVPESERCVVVTNGDIITAENLSNVTGRFRLHQEANPAHQATIMVVPFVSPYGLVDLKGQDDVVEGFREKVELPYWTNAGIYAFSREIEGQFAGDGRPRRHPPSPPWPPKGSWRPSVPASSGGAWTPSRTSERRRST